MGDSNQPINSGISVHYHDRNSSQGGALKSDKTEIEFPDGSGQYIKMEAFI
tara:strand:- start:596 stop:748 length:153 start_codon:yes stop_codon:yes gene_type:complete